VKCTWGLAILKGLSLRCFFRFLAFVDVVADYNFEIDFFLRALLITQHLIFQIFKWNSGGHQICKLFIFSIFNFVRFVPFMGSKIWWFWNNRGYLLKRIRISHYLRQFGQFVLGWIHGCLANAISLGNDNKMKQVQIGILLLFKYFLLVIKEFKVPFIIPF